MAKEFEMIDSVQRIIVEDEFQYDFELREEDEDWEDIYGDYYPLQRQLKKSYSEVVQDHDRW